MRRYMIKLGQFCWHGNPFSFACILRSRLISWRSWYLVDHFEFLLSKVCKTGGVFCQFGKQYYYHDHHVTNFYQDGIGHLVFGIWLCAFFVLSAQAQSLDNVNIVYYTGTYITRPTRFNTCCHMLVVEISCLKIHSTLCKGLSLNH